MEKNNPGPGILTELAPDCVYRYRTVSVSHIKELQEEIDDRKRSGKLSNNSVYRSYLDELRFELPPDFSEAKSLIILAIQNRPMVVTFQLNGAKHAVVLPHTYYNRGLTLDMLKNEVSKNILPEPGHRLEQIANIHLKLLAVRSGLGKYGRNNIFYAEGMGSFLALRALLTDYEFGEDNWGRLEMLDLCEKCRLCLKQCPTGAIRADDFVIDAGKCISLFNEVAGDFPDWIPANSHNALLGCMRCQASCPANREAAKHYGRFEDITEAETHNLLSGNPEEVALHSVFRKLKLEHLLGTQEGVEIIRRNLSVLLPQKVRSTDPAGTVRS